MTTTRTAAPTTAWRNRITGSGKAALYQLLTSYAAT